MLFHARQIIASDNGDCYTKGFEGSQQLNRPRCVSREYDDVRIQLF